MTDAITPHEDARLTLHRHFGAGAPRVEAADCYRIVLRYINQQEKLSTRPSPEPSSKPGELAMDGLESVWLVQVGRALLNYVARTEEEANAHIGPDVAQGFKAVEYVPREPAHAVDADEVERVAQEGLRSSSNHLLVFIDGYPPGLPFEITAFHEPSGARKVAAYASCPEKAQAAAQYVEELGLTLLQVRDCRVPSQSPPPSAKAVEAPTFAKLDAGRRQFQRLLECLDSTVGFPVEISFLGHQAGELRAFLDQLCALVRSRPVVVDASFTRKEIEAAFDTAMRKCLDKGADAHQRDAIIAFGQDTLDALRSLVARKA